MAAVFGGVGGLVFIIFWMVFVFKFLVPMHRRQIKEMREDKKEKARLKLEIETAKAKAALEVEAQKAQTAFELEQKRENMKPRYCPYCGCRNDSGAQKCTSCNARLD
jgi:flagellar biosynthesis/type III secretory pathway M-ring protein FliF/YscJ